MTPDAARALRTGALGLALAVLALPGVAGALLPGAGVAPARLLELAGGHLALSLAALAVAGAAGVSRGASGRTGAGTAPSGPTCSATVRRAGRDSVRGGAMGESGGENVYMNAPF